MSSHGGSRIGQRSSETGHRIQLLREAAARRLAQQRERETFGRMEAVGRELEALADDLSEGADVAYTAYLRNPWADPRD